MEKKDVRKLEKLAKMERHKAELAEKIAKCICCDLVCES